MGTIKKFKGGVPPTLRNGEWATNGNYAYLGMPFDEYKVFQGIFDLSESQSVSGFEFEPGKKGFIIEKDTPFSQIVDLINSLPKALKYNDDDATSIDLLFEDSPYMDDTGARITFRDFSYTINLKPLADDSNVVFDIDNAFLINNSNVNFQKIKFQYPASKGALELFNSSATLTECNFEAKQDETAGDIVFKDLGLNRIVVVKPTFKMEANDVGSIFNVIESGTTANLVNPTLSDPDYAPHTAAGLLKGGIIIIGNANNLKPSGVDALQTSPTSNEHGGIEIRTTFADSISGSVTGISYNDLADKPNTITAEQATAIEANTAKRSYPEADENKLSGIEENATAGADWDSNIANKPTTISAEQATAIEANSAKRSYPEADETKLGGIEENATAGADWVTTILSCMNFVNICVTELYLILQLFFNALWLHVCNFYCLFCITI